ncbi:MAG TPA: zf-HC2 domain-containing protein [Spongiibacteraceae bacterium]
MTSIDRDEHCAELLPSYRRLRLSAAETDAIDAHLEHCATCRDELHFVDRMKSYFERKLLADEMLQQWLQTYQLKRREWPPANDTDSARAQRNFEKLWQHIEASTPCATNKKRNNRWLSFAAAALVVIVAGVSLHDYMNESRYRTLANSGVASPCGALHVRFVDNLASNDLQYLLQAVDAQIIAGPSAQGVYTLRTKQRDSTLQRLHMHPAVLLAEPTSC